MQYFLFRKGMINFIFMILLIKIIMHLVNRENQGWVVFCVAIAHSTFYLTHECFFYYGDTSISYSYYVMFLWQKLSTLGFWYQDGMKNETQLDSHGRRCRIFKIPTFVEMLSYATYPCTCYVGPSFEFKDYINFIEEKGDYSEIPFWFWKGVLKYVKGIPCMIIVIITGFYISKSLLLSEEFGNYNFFKQNWYCFIFLINFKYGIYAVWYFADGTSILSGLGYVGKDAKGKHNFDRVKAFNYWDIEFGTNPRQVINNWNIQVASWLKNYIYIRVEEGDKKRQNKATILVFMTSAFWHGFMPSYYLFFLAIDILLSSSRIIHKNAHRFSFISPFQKIIGFILTQYLILQLGWMYAIRTGEGVWKFNKNTNFSGVIILTLAYFFTKYWLPKEKKTWNLTTNKETNNESTATTLKSKDD